MLVDPVSAQTKGGSVQKARCLCAAFVFNKLQHTGMQGTNCTGASQLRLFLFQRPPRAVDPLGTAVGVVAAKWLGRYRSGLASITVQVVPDGTYCVRDGNSNV